MYPPISEDEHRCWAITITRGNSKLQGLGNFCPSVVSLHDLYVQDLCKDSKLVDLDTGKRVDYRMFHRCFVERHTRPPHTINILSEAEDVESSV